MKWNKLSFQLIWNILAGRFEVTEQRRNVERCGTGGEEPAWLHPQEKLQDIQILHPVHGRDRWTDRMQAKHRWVKCLTNNNMCDEDYMKLRRSWVFTYMWVTFMMWMTNWPYTKLNVMSALNVRLSCVQSYYVSLITLGKEASTCGTFFCPQWSYSCNQNTYM